jgi:hypothetical protein
MSRHSLEGGCFCGAIRYRVTGRPRGIPHCHCIDCRRVSGSAFLTWIELERDQFELIAGSPGRLEYESRVVRGFCTTCGTPLTYERIKEPEFIDVTLCSLDDPEAFRPEDHVWTDRQLSWADVGAELPRHARGRPGPPPGEGGAGSGEE